MSSNVPMFKLARAGLPPLYHLLFAEKKAMGTAMMRLSEFLESDHFKGRIFTTREFEVWYEEHKAKDGPYWSHWRGYNIPFEGMSQFAMTEFARTGPPEECFAIRLAQLLLEQEGSRDVYLITSCEDDPCDLTHEISHALWHYSRQYRDDMFHWLEGPHLLPLAKRLEEAGYSRALFIDEMAAYMVADDGSWVTEGLELDKVEVGGHNVRERVREIFRIACFHHGIRPEYQGDW